MWDNDILLDLLLPRAEVNPRIFELYASFVHRKEPICVASCQLPTVWFVLEREFRRLNPGQDLEVLRGDWARFLRKVRIIKTPSYASIDELLGRKDVEDYVISLSAQAVGAKVITRDQRFLKSSPVAVSIKDVLLKCKQTDEAAIPFLDLKSINFRHSNELESAFDGTFTSGCYILASIGF